MGDTIIALYQNGERVRPENGYPLRLVVPGWIGNINVKWLRRIKVTEGPTETKDETSRYTELRPDGKAWQFQLVMDVKSLICRPSHNSLHVLRQDRLHVAHTQSQDAGWRIDSDSGRRRGRTRHHCNCGRRNRCWLVAGDCRFW